VRAAVDQDVGVAQQRRQRLLVRELLQVGPDYDLVDAGIGREARVDLRVDLLGEKRDVVPPAETLHRDGAQRGDQGVDLGRAPTNRMRSPFSSITVERAILSAATPVCVEFGPVNAKPEAGAVSGVTRSAVPDVPVSREKFRFVDR
jgi:hypothetical protein